MAGKQVTTTTVTTALEKVAVRQAIIDAGHANSAKTAAVTRPAASTPTGAGVGGGDE